MITNLRYYFIIVLLHAAMMPKFATINRSSDESIDGDKIKQ